MSPYGDIVLLGQMLHGMTLYGGSNGLGTIFRMRLDGSLYRTVHHFSGCDGAMPGGSLALGSDFRLYGMTQSGGRYDKGVVFAFEPRRRYWVWPEPRTPIPPPGGSFTLVVEGVPGVIYQIDASTNLVNWTTLTNLTSTGGFIVFTDLSATNFPGRFYRAVWSP